MARRYAPATEFDHDAYQRARWAEHEGEGTVPGPVENRAIARGEMRAAEEAARLAARAVEPEADPEVSGETDLSEV